MRKRGSKITKSCVGAPGSDRSISAPLGATSPGSLDLSGLSFESRDMEGACFADSLLHGASFKDANLQVSVGAVGSHVVRMPRSRARTPRALRATPREADDLNAINSLLLPMTAMVQWALTSCCRA